MGCVDPFKGLLIMVVVMDHNNEAHALFPNAFRPLTFHVLGFLLLPFLIGRTRLSRSFILDRFARYTVPQFWILTLAAFMLWLTHDHSQVVARVARDYVLALVIGSAPLVKRSSGFLAYWFLPTLLGLVVVLAAYRAMADRWRRPAIALLIAAHCVLTASYFPAYQWVPFGLAIVANVFVLGLLLARIAESKAAFAVRWLFPVVFVLSYGWLMRTGTWLEVAVLEMAPVTRIVPFVVQDVAGLSGVVTVLLFADRMKASRAIASVGSLSLMIYLIHPLVYAVLESVAGIAGWHPPTPGTALAYGALNYCLALSMAWIVAGLIARSPTMSRWITPRDGIGWPPLGAFRAAKAG
jgi:Fucose 4-O-acetylase and related acetyltransferases